MYLSDTQQESEPSKSNEIDGQFVEHQTGCIQRFNVSLLCFLSDVFIIY